jgi:hypothetical protein
MIFVTLSRGFTRNIRPEHCPVTGENWSHARAVGRKGGCRSFASSADRERNFQPNDRNGRPPQALASLFMEGTACRIGLKNRSQRGNKPSAPRDCITKDRLVRGKPHLSTALGKNVLVSACPSPF